MGVGHVVYLVFWPKIGSYLSTLEIPFDLHITCWDESMYNVAGAARTGRREANLHPFTNQSMDMEPFPW
jgi:hypothetical protein